MKISELMEGKMPGSVKIRHKAWSPGVFFYPHFTINNYWYGTDLAVLQQWHVDDDRFELYQEPKKKVVRWLWHEKLNHQVSCCLEAEGGLPDNWVKLEWSKTETDE